ncbi:ABC transporter substrate-binding protein [Nocardia spumae]|uniref:ABC transporter substrate-binding protein n=1 Tax=Nocardia spumae TaxID=2887190 RepID=UPI001D1359FE|nr:sugar ABC transporter substrate-binding protein [Nocardia spumae]
MAALGALSTGCSDHDDDALTFFFQARPEEARARMRIIEAFAARRPDIGIRTVLSSPDPLQQMLTYCAGGRCPDVLMAWELLYAGLAQRGVLLDLNTMLARDPAAAATLRADGFSTLSDTFAYNGGRYALPEQWSGVFIYYNRKLFDQAGIHPPTRWSGSWTFAEFLAAAQATTRRVGRVRQWGFVDGWVPYYSAACFALNNGAQWFSPAKNPTRTEMGDPRFAEGFQFYADLSVRYGVAPSNADRQSLTASDVFASGRAGMLLGGHWLYSELVEHDDLDFDVTALPVGPHGGPDAVTDVGCTGLAIAASSPRREKAWEFVKFATGPEGQELIARSGLFVPVLRSAMSAPGFAAAHREVRNREIFTEGPAHSRLLAVTPAWGKVDSLLSRNCNRVLRGAAPATWLAGTAADVDQLLRERI